MKAKKERERERDIEGESQRVFLCTGSILKSWLSLLVLAVS